MNVCMYIRAIRSRRTRLWQPQPSITNSLEFSSNDSRTSTTMSISPCVKRLVAPSAECSRIRWHGELLAWRALLKRSGALVQIRRLLLCEYTRMTLTASQLDDRSLFVNVPNIDSRYHWRRSTSQNPNQRRRYAPPDTGNVLFKTKYNSHLSKVEKAPLRRAFFVFVVPLFHTWEEVDLKLIN